MYDELCAAAWSLPLRIGIGSFMGVAPWTYILWAGVM